MDGVGTKDSESARRERSSLHRRTRGSYRDRGNGHLVRSGDGQIPPRDTGAGQVQQRLKEQAVGEFWLLPAAMAFGLFDGGAEFLLQGIGNHPTHDVLP